MKTEQLYTAKYNFKAIANSCIQRNISIEEFAEELKQRFLQLFKEHGTEGA